MALVHSRFGSIGVEVEGQPGYGEGIVILVVGMGGFVGGDGAVEFIFADVAPGADGVGDDGDGEVGHFAEDWMESQFEC